MKKCEILGGALLLIILAACIIGCSGSIAGNPTPPPPAATVVSVKIVCSAAPCAIQAGKQLPFTAEVVVTGNESAAVTWYVCEGTATTPTACVADGNSNVGTIDNTGLYTAPDTIPSGGNVVIEALGADNKTFGAVTITVTQTVPARPLVYANQGSAPCCGYVSRIWVDDLNNPTTQYQLSTDTIASEDLYPTISTDGTTVAWIRYSSQGNILLTDKIAGGEQVTVVTWATIAFTPMGIDWNPLGWVIAYVSPTICGLELVAADGSVKRLTVTNIDCSGGIVNPPPTSPHFFGDGRIAYEVSGAIVVVSSDATTTTTIPNTGMAGDIALSPDGKKVAFDDDEHNTSVINIDGTGKVLLATDAGYPAWCSGDNEGKIILRDGSYHLFSINPDGTGKEYIADGAFGVTPYCR